jgi:hypothetical protein
MAGTWCTIEEAANLTGVTVDDAQLLQAQGVIETYVDVDPADPGEHLSVRDREHLVKATAYQAGWMWRQIEVARRTDVENLQQDGVGFTYAHPDAVVLAPLAKRNIDRLSWNQSGAVAPQRAGRYPDIDAVRDAVLRDEVDPVGWCYESEGV